MNNHVHVGSSSTGALAIVTGGGVRKAPFVERFQAFTSFVWIQGTAFMLKQQGAAVLVPCPSEELDVN